MMNALASQRFSKPLIAYGMMIAFLMAIGTWLINDFWKERERIIAETGQLAIYQSELVGSLFGNNFLAIDYVLHDIAGHITVALEDKKQKLPLSHLTSILERKLTSVRGLHDLMILDEKCTFVAVAKVEKLIGSQSRQDFCKLSEHPAGENIHIQYMPPNQSLSGKPIVLMSLVMASAQGRMQAVVTAVIHLDYAQRWIEGLNIYGNDIKTIVDTNGVILARNPPFVDSLGKTTKLPLGQPVFHEIRRGHVMVVPSPFDNRERIIGSTRLERFPFIAMVGYDKERVLQGWRQRAWQFAFGFIVLSILLLALVRDYLYSVRQGILLHEFATTDALTGIANRRQLFHLGERETTLALRDGKPLAVLMMDIDFFKNINDRWGHPSGDRVIQHTADIMRSVLRTSDIGGRLGGEEFTIILPATDMREAYQLAERLRLAIATSESVYSDDGQIIRYTISIGIAVSAEVDTAFESILQRADEALYHAKEAGRNCVALADESL